MDHAATMIHHTHHGSISSFLYHAIDDFEVLYGDTSCTIPRMDNESGLASKKPKCWVVCVVVLSPPISSSNLLS